MKSLTTDSTHRLDKLLVSIAVLFDLPLPASAALSEDAHLPLRRSEAYQTPGLKVGQRAAAATPLHYLRHATPTRLNMETHSRQGGGLWVSGRGQASRILIFQFGVVHHGETHGLASE